METTHEKDGTAEPSGEQTQSLPNPDESVHTDTGDDLEEFLRELDSSDGLLLRNLLNSC